MAAEAAGGRALASGAQASAWVDGMGGKGSAPERASLPDGRSFLQRTGALLRPLHPLDVTRNSAHMPMAQMAASALQMTMGALMST
eukprot:CAMPEP_0174753042 /NCGR_PEP_ID=MMETSP1094-20130205/103312_1 /TAXON_ID=156173 /ORGANISM="Chrysochromulina brevifilum, Strain UTEX LB 985" /LENGTH=85 /DNA_ID=CAMNT_0015958753 /DNA_START=289 /DNA_END=544 /DNA_ORIENTATION=+